MNFAELCSKIKAESKKGTFENSTDLIQGLIFNLGKQELIPLVTEIGAIPEDIGHDSTEEKLYAKASDIVLAKCFQELGLKSSVNKERSNCADVAAKSQFHNYSLAGDAKSFRLSRTAKNQKDFKVKSMAEWKGDNRLVRQPGWLSHKSCNFSPYRLRNCGFLKEFVRKLRFPNNSNDYSVLVCPYYQ